MGAAVSLGVMQVFINLQCCQFFEAGLPGHVTGLSIILRATASLMSHCGGRSDCQFRSYASFLNSQCCQFFKAGFPGPVAGLLLFFILPRV